MRVLLYSEGDKVISKSGLGKAIKHQEMALRSAGVDYTLDLKDDYDILHINTYFPLSYEVAKKAKKNGKKIVYHAHSTEEDYKNGFILSKQTASIFKKWLIKCYSLGDVIVTPTPYSKRILESYGIDKKIYAISNGIEIEKFEKTKDKRDKFRKKYGYSDNDKIVVGIGLYIERKGIVDFVELAKRLPQYKFIWFGYSPLSATTKVVREAVNTKLSNLIFAGYVESDMISCALCGSDLFLFPTLEETEGIPIIEACASRCKALIRDIPVFDDWLADGVNVYKAIDVDDFENKIIKILENKLPDLTDVAYKVAVDRRIELIGEELKKVYENVLKR